MYFVASRACIERVCKKGASERERGGGEEGGDEKERECERVRTCARESDRETCNKAP